MTRLIDLKPLFIPLNGEHFDAFMNGSKDTEYRLHGKRWNLKTCFSGGQVILSRGYGKQNRARGVVHAAHVLPRSLLNTKLQWTLRHIYGLGIGENPEFMCIEICDIERLAA